MQSLFIKKTFLGLVGLLVVTSLLVYPGSANLVDAGGGNTIYIPVVFGAVTNSNQAGTGVIFGPNASWKYFDRGAAPGAGWHTAGFNDSDWKEGSAPLGYGNGNERTVVSYGPDANNKYITTYFRKTFSVSNVASLKSLKATLLRDDGAIVFLNGQEVIRSNMPAGGASYSTLAASNGEATETHTIDPRRLVEGKNVIAVEIHQDSAKSSDIAFGLVLEAGTSAPSPQPTPTAKPPAQPTAPPPPPTSGGRAFYVAPDGSSSNDGSANRPWSLAHALSHPSAVKPGDTIWVRGGKYSGAFATRLKGSSSAWITVRAYPRERATLVGNTSSPVLDIAGAAYVQFWGLEITQSYSSRSTNRSESTYGIRVNQGTPSHHVKFINMIVHDVLAQGAGWWQALTDSEIYGSLFYFNGTTQLDHGVYFHNVNGTKYFTDNIVADNASHGFHGYAETAEKGLNNIVMSGNTFFNNGSVGYNTSKGEYGVYKRNVLVGGLTPAKNPVITNNYTYYPGSSGSSLNLGYDAGSSGAKVQNNYFAGGSFVMGGSNSSLTLSGNTIYAPGGVQGVNKSTYSNNAWLSSKPSGTQMFVRPNKYEANRANITIFNWSKQSTVNVPASHLGGIALKPGDRYELHNAQNFYGDVITGTYNGSGISVPMTNRVVAQPLGLKFKPASTFPEFGAFVLIVIGP